MTTLTYAPMQRPAHSHHHTGQAIAVALFGVAMLFGFLANGFQQWVTTCMLVAIGVLLIFVQPNVAVIMTLVYLTFMGDIRRYAVTAGAGMVKTDPLLLVAPIVIAVLFLFLLVKGNMRRDTLLSKLVLALMALMTLEIFNPLQGGPLVGLTGSLVYMVPLLWYWVGKALPNERAAESTLRTAIPLLGLAAATLGLFQVYVGWLRFEAEWIAYQLSQGGFSAILIGNARQVRPFAFFPSPAEYAGFLALTFAGCIAPVVLGRLRWQILVVPAVGLALFLAAVRTEITMAIVAVLVIWIVAARNRPEIFTRSAVVLVLVLPGLIYGLRSLKDVDDSTEAGELAAHVYEGLNDPTNSSATAHASENVEGILSGFTNPAGYGLGSTTAAAAKFGSSGNVAGYEKDVPNIFHSLGAAGGILYLIIMYEVFRTAMRLWMAGRSVLVLAVIGILVSQLGYWLMGSEYSVAALVWFLIGSIDRHPPVPLPRSDLARARGQFRPPVLAAAANRVMPGRAVPPARNTGMA